MSKVDVREYYARIRALSIGAVAEDVLAGRITSRSGTVLLVDCPRHASSSKVSFHVYLSENRWRCWGCGVGGDVIQLVEFVGHGCVTKGVRGAMPKSHRMARDFLAAKAGLLPLGTPQSGDTDAIEATQEHREAEAAIAALTDLAEIFHEHLLASPDVLAWVGKQWGFGRDSVSKHMLGFAPETGQWTALADRGHDERACGGSGAFYFDGRDHPIPVFRGRVIFPYFSGGRVVYMIGRRTPWSDKSHFERAKYKKLPVWDPEHRKFISPAINNRALWGEDILTSKPERVIVTEGVADAVASQDAGFPTVSPVTTRFAKKDVERLVSTMRGVRTVFFVQDNELSGIGEAAAFETARALEAEGVRCLVGTIPLGEDQIAAREEFARLIGPDAMAQWRSEDPARRRKILEERLAGDKEKIDHADTLLDRGKIDLCAWYAAGGTPAKFEEILASARSPIEVLIDGLRATGSEMERIRAAETVLTEIGLQRPTSQEILLRRLKERIDLPVSILGREARALAKRQLRSVPRGKSRAPASAPGVVIDVVARVTKGGKDAPGPESAPEPAEESCREFVEREKEAANLARVQLDWALMAERVYEWIESKGGRFFAAQDGAPILFWRDEVYEMRSDAQGPRAKYEGLMWRLSGTSPTTSGERRMFAVMSALASDRGERYKPFPWIATDITRRVVHVLLGDGSRKLARITENGVEIVPNGQNADGVILRGDPKFAALAYTDEHVDLDAELGRLIISRMACPPEHARVVVDWISSVFLIGFAGTRPMVRLEGEPSSGKSWAAKLITTLLYGAEAQKRSTNAANWADSTRNPLVALDNIETNDVDAAMVAFLLTSTTGIQREKRAAGTDTANVIERPESLILTTGVEPLAGDLQEVMTRSMILEFDRVRQGEPILERAALAELRDARDRLLSAILRRTSVILGLMGRDGHARAVRALRAAMGKHERNRCDEYIALMYLQRVAAAPEERREHMLDHADMDFVRSIESVNVSSKTTFRESSPITVGLTALFVLLEHDREFREESGLRYTPSNGFEPARIVGCKTDHLFIALREVGKRRSIPMPFTNTSQFGRRLNFSIEMLKDRGILAAVERDRLRSSVWTLSMTESSDPHVLAMMGIHTNGAENGAAQNGSHAVVIDTTASATQPPARSGADDVAF